MISGLIKELKTVGGRDNCESFPSKTREKATGLGFQVAQVFDSFVGKLACKFAARVGAASGRHFAFVKVRTVRKGKDGIAERATLMKKRKR